MSRSRYKFLKMNGLGNDFIIFGLNADSPEHLSPEVISSIASRVGDMAGEDATDAINGPEQVDRVWPVGGTGAIGCDQVIVVERETREADVVASADVNADSAPALIRIKAEIFNSDGSRASACGNATRCLIGWLCRDAAKAEMSRENDVAGSTGAGDCDTYGMAETEQFGAQRVEVSIGNETLHGYAASGDRVTVELAAPSWEWQKVPLAQQDAVRHLNTLARAWLPNMIAGPDCLSVANPHCVLWVADIDAIDLSDLGPKLERNPLFPDRANITFAAVSTDNGHTVGEADNSADSDSNDAIDICVNVRVWERGAGATRACGSAACATAAALVRRCGDFTNQNLTAGANVRVSMPGGALDIVVHQNGSLSMSGAWQQEFEGEIDLDSLDWINLSALSVEQAVTQAKDRRSVSSDAEVG